VTSALLFRTQHVAEQVVDEAAFAWDDPDPILLAGGSTRMPMVRAMLGVVLDRSTWTPPAVFSVLGEFGGVEPGERQNTWNCGIGMLALVPAEVSDQAVALLAERDVAAWVAG
jgi:phosphoribosylformylglycinamidine cyclo-ligase